MIPKQILGVTNNTKQGLIVTAIFFGGVLLVGVGIAAIAARKNTAVAFSSVRQSMERSYRELLASSANASNHNAVLATAADLRTAFCEPDHGQLKYCDFLDSADIWIAREPVDLRANTPICVVSGFSNSLYNVEADGVFRRVTGAEFATWPHVGTRRKQSANFGPLAPISS